MQLFATGTTCVDNIYFVDDLMHLVGIITCNIMTGVNTTGIDTSSGLELLLVDFHGVD